MLVLFLSVAAERPLPAADLLRVAKSADAIGSTYSVELYGRDRAQLEDAADAALDEAKRLDDLLSNYKPDGEWSPVNQRAAEGPLRISKKLFGVARGVQECSSERSAGFMRARAIAARGGSGCAIDESGLPASPGCPGANALESNWIRAGIGKGYAVDRMVEILKRKGIGVALVAGSGSSIYWLGAPPSSPQGWPIRDPWNHEKTLTTVYLKNMSMSTSGSCEKFFRAEGKVFAHIMDPRTGYSAQGSDAVSVATPRTIDSVAWAKPYFINGCHSAAEHKPKDFRIYFCEDRRDQPCAWLQ